MPPRPSEVAAVRIRELRKSHRWSQQDLADRLTELGHPIDRVAIAKLEPGTKEKRGLSLDETLAFALALDVAPTNLFLPLEDQEVRVAGNVVVGPRRARYWVAGEKPLEGQNPRFYFSEVSDEMWDEYQRYREGQREVAEEAREAARKHREAFEREES